MKYLYTTLAAALLGIAGWSSAAAATTLTFGTYDGSGPDGIFETIGSSYTEAGYQLTSTGALARWQDGIIYDADPTPSTGLFTNTIQSTTTLTKIGGGAFTLFSLDVDEVNHIGSRYGPLDYTYSLLGGGSGTGSFDIDDVPGYASLVLNLANLISFSFTPSANLGYVQFDNVVVDEVSAVPVPAALPLFAAAIGLLGLANRRRLARLTA